MKRNKKRNAPRNKKRWNQGTKRIKGLRKEKIRKRKQVKTMTGLSCQDSLISLLKRLNSQQQNKIKSKHQLHNQTSAEVKL